MIVILTPDARLVGFQIRSRHPRVRAVKAAMREMIEAQKGARP